MDLKQIKQSFVMNIICITILLARILEGNLRFIVVDLIVIGYLCFRCFQLIKEVKYSTPAKKVEK